MTFGDPIHAEAAGQLERIYSSLDLPFVGTVTEQEADLAIQYFLLAVLEFGNFGSNNHVELKETKPVSLKLTQFGRT